MREKRVCIETIKLICRKKIEENANQTSSQQLTSHNQQEIKVGRNNYILYWLRLFILQATTGYPLNFGLVTSTLASNSIDSVVSIDAHLKFFKMSTLTFIKYERPSKSNQ